MSFKEKLENVQINMEQFYKMGIYCFLVIASANTFTMIIHWNNLILSSKVSSIFGIIFNFGLVLFFKYLRNTLPGKQKSDSAPKDINFDEMIDKLEN